MKTPTHFLAFSDITAEVPLTQPCCGHIPAPAPAAVAMEAAPLRRCWRRVWTR